MGKSLLKIFKTWGLLCLVGAGLLSCCATRRAVPTHPSQITYRPLEVKVQKPERSTLPDGMALFTMEDHDLPLVHLRAVIRTGSIYEPGDKVGLASLCGTTLRTGGTEKMTGDEIDDELEFLAAAIESSIGREVGTVTLSCQSKDLDRCLKIFADVLTRPRFAEDKIDIQLGRMKDAIRRQNDDPARIANREFPMAVYGKESPWAWVPTLDSLDRIPRQDLVDWHDRYYHPNNVMLGVAGDFDSASLAKSLEKVFAGWGREEVEIPTIPPVDTSVNPRVVYIPKDLAQSTIRMGHFGYNRLSPDRFPIEVLNYIYGIGGFRSRLMMEVRSDRGLAYSVWGYIGRGTDIGLFTAGCQTKSESTIEAIRVMTSVTEEMRDRPVSEEELRDAIEAMSNQFVFNFDSPAKIVDQAVDLTYYNYPEDYLDTYIQKLKAVTAEDVLRVAQEYLHPDKMAILVVGDKDKFDGDLSALGPVELMNLE